MAPPNPYYDLVRESRMSEKLRLRMVRFAKKNGVKPAARAFGTTPKTVRKWVGRFDGTLKSLQELSRRPHRSPNKLSAEAEAEILAARKKAPCLGSRRLRAEFDLPFSEKAINRVLGEHGLLRPRRRRKHETKRCLREVKKRWRFLQQIDVDTKNLSDIPEYWALREELRLPKYQYTARDVSTGLCFVAFAHEISMLHSVIFAELVIAHLVACGFDLSKTTWQTDNGSEFVGSWQSSGPSAFIRLIESVPGSRHKAIPPGAHRFQSDVETFHSLEETEFFEVERFTSREDFLAKAAAYMVYFNAARKNSGKEMKTPLELIREKHPGTWRELTLFRPVVLDELAEKRVQSPDRGYDVRRYPSPAHPACGTTSPLACCRRASRSERGHLHLLV